MMTRKKGTGMTSQQKAAASNKRIIEDLTSQIEAARKAQSAKLEQSKEYLVSQLEMVSKKYMTVNGYMQARTTVEQASFNDEIDEDARSLAQSLARTMFVIAGELAGKMKDADVSGIDETILDGYLDKTFIETSTPSVRDTALQLLIVNLLQNIGPSIDDMVSFREATSSEIEKLVSELEERKASGPDVEAETSHLSLVKGGEGQTDA